MYDLEHGTLVMNPDRMFLTTPVIKLSDSFKKVKDFEKRIGGSIPNMLELDHLTVSFAFFVFKPVRWADVDEVRV